MIGQDAIEVMHNIPHDGVTQIHSLYGNFMPCLGSCPPQSRVQVY